MLLIGELFPLGVWAWDRDADNARSACLHHWGLGKRLLYRRGWSGSGGGMFHGRGGLGGVGVVVRVWGGLVVRGNGVTDGDR